MEEYPFTKVLSYSRRSYPKSRFRRSLYRLLNLVSRYHSIQAQITAKERIQILSGNHNYDYTNSIVDSTTATNSANGEFAVDISALGNIQAGSIFFKAQRQD